MTTDAVGGVFTYARDLSRELSLHGVHVALAILGPRPSPEQRRALSAIEGLTVFENEHALEWMDDPWHDVDRAGEWLLELERELRPDVVHSNCYAHAALGFRAPVLVVAHSCVLSWWRAVFGEDAPPRYDEYRRRVARGLAAASAVVAPTRAMLRMLEAEHGPVVNASVLPNGADASTWRPRAKEPFVLCSGRLWDRAKNVSALAALAEQLPWPLRVAGDVEHPGGGGDRFSSSVVLLGKLGRVELSLEMGRAAVFAHPARYEPFGLAPLEAALSGCALLLGDIPSLREIWEDDALFVDPGDPDALLASLLELARDGELREQLARRAQRRALTFSAERMADGYLSLYRALSSQSSARGVASDGRARSVPGAHVGDSRRDRREEGAA